MTFIDVVTKSIYAVTLLTGKLKVASSLLQKKCSILKSLTLNQKPETLERCPLPKPYPTLNRKSEPANPKPQTPNLKPKPQTPKTKPAGHTGNVCILEPRLPTPPKRASVCVCVCVCS